MLKQGLYEQVVNTEIKDELRQLPEEASTSRKSTQPSPPLS